MSDSETNLRDAWYKEYETLREESLQSIGNRTQIVSFGLGTIGVLAGGMLAAQNPSPHLVGIIFGTAIPLVSVLLYVAWFAEFERMVRAGKFIQQLEQRINATLPSKVIGLSWEKYLETARMGYAYVIIGLLFLGIAAGAPYVGIWVQQDNTAIAGGFLGLPNGYEFGDLLAESFVAWLLLIAAGLHTGRRYLRVLPSYRL
jgi:hypothetical protein